MRVAQTNVQLYNELRARDLALAELVLVHRAYELLTTLYPGYYQADGKPFVAHGVGVASILGHLGQPGDIVAVGLLHNVYGNADFGDGRGAGATPARRRLVRDGAGRHVEELVFRFAELRRQRRGVEGLLARRAKGQTGVRADTLDITDRRLLVIDLADYLEKYVDLGVLYFGENDWVIDTTRRLGTQLTGLAEELGEPRLAQALRAAFADTAAQARDVPPELRVSDGRRYLELAVPRSCRRRIAPALREKVYALRKMVYGRMARVRGLWGPRSRLRRLRDRWPVRRWRTGPS
ncbi:MAG: DUF6817 domain-containing protein [Solirubrobacteraceae bacterium]